MAKTYKALYEKPEADLYRDLIFGRQDSETEAPTTGGLGGTPNRSQPETPEEERSMFDEYVAPVLEKFGLYSSEPERVADALVRTQDDTEEERSRVLEGWSNLPGPPTRGRSQTDLAFSEAARMPSRVMEAPVSSERLGFARESLGRDEEGRPTESLVPEARPEDLDVDFEELMANQLRTHEGYRPYPYKDSRGLWTIGIGHLIGDGSSKGEYAQYSKDNPMPDEMVQELFREDYQEHLAIAERYPFWDRLDLSGKRAILDMTFNMGNLMSGWSNTMALINEGKLDEAADVIENSLYARQVGNRANTIADMIRSAELEPLAPEESLVPRPRPNTEE